MPLFFLFLIPLLAAGVIILRKVSTVSRFELLFPAGSILGLAFFTFFLNAVALILKGKTGIVVAYFLTFFVGFTVLYLFKKEKEKISFPKGRQLIYWFTGIIIWGGFVFWKAAFALIGSDANIYYAAAATFIKGNFPLMTPWQPDIPFSYHTGASELLGAFNVFSGLNFQFLHLFFAAFFIFCIAQIIIMIILNSASIIKFLFANLAAAAVLISWGFFYLVWPVFPLDFPKIEGFNGLILWLRNLPNAANAIEIYGAPFNIDALIYFLFHAFGFGLFFSLLILTANLKKNNSIFSLAAVFTGLAALALINESVFAAAFPAIFLGIIIINFYRKTLIKNLKKILLLTGFLFLTVFLQGGVISAVFNTSSAIEKAILVFPSKEDIKDDFQAYYPGQESFKFLPPKKEWLPLGWIHPGIVFMMVCSIPALFWFKEKDKSLIIMILFTAGFSSLLAFNFIVPKFLIANGNRFLSASYIFFSLILNLSFIWFYEVQKKKSRRVLLLIIALWILIPTIVPPLALISKTRFGENKLIPKKPEISEGINRLKERQFNERVLVLDKNAPHPSGQFRAMIDAGVFAPLFAGNFRAFTVEASPEYLDAAYFLSPKALSLLKVDTLLIDDMFYQKLPEIRKQQLNNDEYFEQIFDQSAGENPEKIFKIKNKYLTEGSEIEGTFTELKAFLPLEGRIYIDSEKSFSPSYLRKALIFSVRDRDIYYLPESGVYLNVETKINFNNPLDSKEYDYLILGPDTDSKEKCSCESKSVWRGFNGQIVVWKKI